MPFIMLKLVQVKKMWKRVELIFELESPLHIGYLPFGGSVIAPTRYYIPGKNFWGAITQKITKYIFDEPESDTYKQIDQSIKKNFRFSYFYVYDGKNIYFPCYGEEGLYYGIEAKIKEQDFEYKYVGSRVLTAINNNTGSAEDETLHEVEFIHDKYIDVEENINKTRIIGTIWIKELVNIDTSQGKKKISIKDDGIYIDNLNIFKKLTIG